MLTRDVRECLYKVERGQYSYEDAMSELVRLSKFLTKEELLMIKNKIKVSIHQ